MPRQKNEIVVSDDTRAMELAAQNQQSYELSVQEIDKKYLPDGEQYNLFICMSRAKDAENTAGQALIALGQQLALIKAHETSEQFHAAMENLDISWRTANYAMAAARKFSNSPLGANFGRTTLKVLTVLDDEQIAEMEETGYLTGVGSVDEIKQMPRKELEDSLRKEKAERDKERDALEAIIRKKESKISELEMEVAGRQPPTKEQIAQERLDGLRVPMMRELATANESIKRCMEIVVAAQKIDGVNVDQLTNFSEQCNELFRLLDDNYQNFCQDMEYIRPTKTEA